MKEAIERSAARFAELYSINDLAHALVPDTRFYDLPVVQEAVLQLLTDPYSPQSLASVEKNLAAALPLVDKTKADEAARTFLEILHGELMSVEKLREMLKVMMQRKGLRQQEEISGTLKRIEELLKPAEMPLDLALTRYLDYLITTNTYVDPRGIMQTTRSVSLKLDEVYVSLTAERESLRERIDERVLRMNEFGRAMESETDADEELADLGFRSRFGARPMEKHVERVDLARAVRDNARIVILGEPGAGKTTLIRFLALQFALAIQNEGDAKALMRTRLSGELDKSRSPIPVVGAEARDKEGNLYGEARLPVLVRVSSYADAFAKNRNLSLSRFLPDAFGDVDVSSEALEKVLREALSEGRTLVLLDGLDEIINASDRAQIARRIEELAAGVSPRNRFIVTSRIAGYMFAPLGGEFMHLRLRELEREQIDRFLNRWCRLRKGF